MNSIAMTLEDREIKARNVRHSFIRYGMANFKYDRADHSDAERMARDIELSVSGFKYDRADHSDAERMARDTELSAAGFKPAQRVYNTFGATNDE